MSLAIGLNVLFAMVFVGLWGGVTYLTYRSLGRVPVPAPSRVHVPGMGGEWADQHGELPAA